MPEVQVDLPPDPAVGEHTGTVAPDAPWQQAITQVEQVAEQVVQTPTVNTPVPPSIITDASGVSHVVIPLTKKTKAYVGTGLALVSDAAALTAFLTLPDNVRLWAAIAAFAAGKLAVFFGIVLPTNLPIRSNKV